MSRRFLALSLALCVPCAAVAAPAPPPRLVTAEAVLKPMRGNPRESAAVLTSRTILNAALRSKAAASLGRLRWEKDPVNWVASRLKATVDADRGTVTVRLADCPRQDAVALLSAVVEAYKADLLGQGRAAAAAQYERAVLVQALVAAQRQNAGGLPIPIAVTIDVAGRHEGGWPSKAEVDASVLRAPRVVQPGLPGKEGAGR
jgi:hypothetical protein